MYVCSASIKYSLARPEDSVISAARLQRDAVPDFMAYVDIHLVSHPQSEINSLLRVNLGAHHHAMLELDRQAELSTPLRNLFQETSCRFEYFPATTSEMCKCNYMCDLVLTCELLPVLAEPLTITNCPLAKVSMNSHFAVHAGSSFLSFSSL